MTLPANDLIQRLPRHLKMGELRVFVTVLEHRSFRKAAAVLHLSQPAVTKAIASLEQTLGCKLFHRVANGVEATVHGITFAPRAVAVFDEMRRAAQDLALISSGAVGTLRVGIVPMPAIPMLPVAIDRLMGAHPDIFVSVVEARETELLDRLRRRDIEVAILRLAVLEPGEDLQVAPLYEERLCVVAGKEHPLAGRSRVTWPDLLRERWVMPPADCFFFEHVQAMLAAVRLADAAPRGRGVLHPHPVRHGAARGPVVLRHAVADRLRTGQGIPGAPALRPGSAPHGRGGRVAQVARAQPVVAAPGREHPRHRSHGLGRRTGNDVCLDVC